ncbi:hypothetical protein KQX54_017446 [Cotesia glomerata]|uniref:Uncharacterized protein n=1 Tax=Cotesia glomerata TaxID=32391 RepID=A0AAV7IQ62_COTGL|nr:hypothetical protein KQX54_017446 [Cotesia glomerata]
MDIKKFELIVADNIPQGVFIKDQNDQVIENIGISGNGQFIYNIQYVVFENILSLRQHHNYQTVPCMSSITDALQTISEELKLQADNAAADNNLKEMFNIFLNLLNDLIKEITSSYNLSI